MIFVPQMVLKIVVKSNRNLNHDDDLMLFAETHGAELEGVQRIAA